MYIILCIQYCIFNTIYVCRVYHVSCIIYDYVSCGGCDFRALVWLFMPTWVNSVTANTVCFLVDYILIHHDRTRPGTTGTPRALSSECLKMAAARVTMSSPNLLWAFHVMKSDWWTILTVDGQSFEHFGAFARCNWQRGHRRLNVCVSFVGDSGARSSRSCEAPR